MAVVFACLVSLVSSRAMAADDDLEKKLIGEWWTPVQGLEEGYLISKTKDDKWKVLVQYRDPDTRKILGGHGGKNYEVRNGKLQFRQVWIHKPKSHWGENA